jgi:hypothetical protein
MNRYDPQQTYINERTVQLTAPNGLTVEVELREGDAGWYVALGGINCDLDGELPGHYWLVPRGEDQRLPVFGDGEAR